MLQFVTEARDVHAVDVTKLGGQFLRIHERTLTECRSRCKKFPAYVSAFQTKLEEELEESKQNG